MHLHLEVCSHFSSIFQRHLYHHHVIFHTFNAREEEVEVRRPKDFATQMKIIDFASLDSASSWNQAGKRCMRNRTNGRQESFFVLILLHDGTKTNLFGAVSPNRTSLKEANSFHSIWTLPGWPMAKFHCNSFISNLQQLKFK